MEYSIHELSKIAKVSTRTLRYYHEINLLYPKRTNSSGYRIYGEKEIDLLIENVEKTISYKKGEINMSDKEKFEAFKKHLINKNEESYGKEIRDKYGDDQINKSNEKMLGLSKEEYAKFEELGDKIIETLKEAMEENNPAGQKAQEACELHKKWLEYSWNFYSKEAHKNLGEMYVLDERFKKYYGNNQEGMAEFFRGALNIYTK